MSIFKMNLRIFLFICLTSIAHTFAKDHKTFETFDNLFSYRPGSISSVVNCSKINEFFIRSFNDPNFDCFVHFNEKIFLKYETVQRQSYHLLFTDYIVRLRPYKSTCENCLRAPATEFSSDSNFENYLIQSNSSLPPILANNYIRLLIHQSKRDFLLPTILEVKTEKMVYGCPFNMSMVVWGLTRAKVRIKLRDNRIENAYHALTNWDIHNLAVKNLNYSESIDVCPRKETDEIELQDQEYLYVPSIFNMILQGKDVDPEFPAHLLAACFVDAGNYFGVISAMGEDLLGLEAIDKKMRREVPDLKWLDYLRYNISAAALEISSSPVSSPKKKRRGTDNRGWKEQVNWDSQVKALTINRPPAPTVAAFDRDWAEIRFELSPSIWDTITDEQRSRLLVVRACRLLSEEYFLFKQYLIDISSRMSFLSDFYQGQALGCSVHNFSQSSWQISHKPVGDVENVEILLRLNELTDDSYYQYQGKFIEGSYASTFSSWSMRLKTLRVRAPDMVSFFDNDLVPSCRLMYLQHLSLNPYFTSSLSSTSTYFLPACSLKVRIPSDDGGRAINRLQIWTRSLKPSQSEWHLLHSNVSHAIKSMLLGYPSVIEAIGFRPGFVYEFKVRACNIVGCGDFSNVSEPIMVPRYDKIGGDGACSVGKLLTLGTNIYSIPELQTYETMSLTHNKSTVRGVIALDFFKQQLVIFPHSNVLQNIPYIELEIWRSHWTSGCSFVLGMPNLTHFTEVGDDLVSSSEHHQPIIFLPRDGRPLYSLAREAQTNEAVAVVIVDDGRCQTYDQRCVPGASKHFREGFAMEDGSTFWSDISIPVALIRSDLASKLREALHELSIGGKRAEL